ncbi:hypothetical protein PG987_013615 [Apiospora arundinis]
MSNNGGGGGGGGGNNNNMSVTTESIIALVGLVLALPPCVVIVWKWRLIRGAVRGATESAQTAEAPQTSARAGESCLSLGTGIPILPLHHSKRAATNASSTTDVSCLAPSTTSRASSTTTIAVPEEEAASSTMRDASSPQETDTPSVTGASAKSTTNPLAATTRNLFMKDGGHLGSSPHRVELMVIEGKIHSIQLLCRNSFSPLFRIPGHPYSLESPV